MGLLEAPKDSAKQLSAGVAKEDGKGDGKPVAETSTGLTPEDLKELEDLDLSELDKTS